ncbi:HAD family hydrolase [Kitasatospora sp. NPDC057512]|uniref:HAD family hydrolase n=1 Tax=Kitasatospora sp. NPDC057512 TaxID=3346154 RepID=UPI00368B19B3
MPGEALFVGDTPWDVQAAAGAQVTRVAVLSGGFGKRAPRSAGALEVHTDVGELLARVGSIALADPTHFQPVRG